VSGFHSQKVLYICLLHYHLILCHVFVEREQLHTMPYGYRFDGVFVPEPGQHCDLSNIVVDPYAKVINELAILS
jgi:pullulanase/glycogen debranching enzyme